MFNINMDIKEFAYIAMTQKNFGEAVVSVIRAIDQKGWAVFGIYDVQERLAAKGFRENPVKIIEFCSAKYANQFLKKNRLVALCLPCKIVVLEDEGKVRIVGMNPQMLAALFSEISAEETASVKQEVQEIVDAAAH